MELAISPPIVDLGQWVGQFTQRCQRLLNDGGHFEENIFRRIFNPFFSITSAACQRPIPKIARATICVMTTE
ncbi:hypothetical protein ASG87_02700 [Frateuria sp. Soil773]|nr:hypothetical protein ASG87_02700 [Frateuria sp. Soil773]